MKNGISSLFVLLALIIFITPVAAQPPMPHHFWGIVTVGDLPAIDGTVVIAKIDGISVENTMTFDGGKYVLKVPGDPSDTVVFFVDEFQAATYEFQSGASTELNLSVPAPKFSVSDLAINPTEVHPRETITITAEVKNEGKVRFAHTVTLRINNVEEAGGEVELKAGESGAVSFTVTKDSPGTYAVEIDGMTGAFTVKSQASPSPFPSPSPSPSPAPVPGPAVFAISSLLISPAEVTIGEVVTISVDVANVGEVEGSYEVDLKIDGTTVQSEEITLAAGETKKVTFTAVENVEGTYTVEIAGMKGTFTVLAPAVQPEIVVPPEIIGVESLPLEIPSIAVEEPAIIEVEETAITEIEIRVVSEVSNVGITVQELTERPAEIEISAPDKVYRHLNIVAENIQDEDIDVVTIEFKVEKSWIEAENIDENTIKLNRYDSSTEEWESLPTENVDEDATHVYYSAESRGFSVFAVTGKVLAPAQLTPTPTEGARMDPWLAGGIIAAVTIGLVALYAKRRR